MQQNKIILWVVLVGIFLVIIAGGAAYFLTRVPAEVKTTALPVAVDQSTIRPNTEPSLTPPAPTTPSATTAPEVSKKTFEPTLTHRSTSTPARIDQETDLGKAKCYG
jgi:hypothetical protein